MIELTQEELKQHFSEPIFGQRRLMRWDWSVMW